MILICIDNDSKTFLTPYIQDFYSFIEHIYLYFISFMLFEKLLLLKFIFIYFDTLKDTKPLIFTPQRYDEHPLNYSVLK